MDLVTVLIIAVSVFLAVVSQLLTGFGFAMVLIPLLMLVIGPAEAVVATNIMGSALSTYLLFHDREFVDKRKALSLLGWAILGLPLGVLAITWLAPVILKWVIVIVVLAALLIVALNLSLPNNRWTTALVGMLSGSLFTSTGVNGPPLVAYIRANNYSVREYRGTLTAVFFVQGWVGVTMLAMAGKVGVATLIPAVIGLAMMPAGFYIGHRLFKHVDAHKLRIGISLMLVLAVVSVIMR